MPRKYVPKKPAVLNERGFVQKPKPGPPKGCTGKNRPEGIEELELQLEKWAKQLVLSGLHVTNSLLFVRMAAIAGKSSGDYYGLRSATKFSWARKFRDRVGLANDPVRKEFFPDKPADELCRSTKAYWKESHKWHKEVLLAGTSPELVTYVNMDEVGVTYTPPKRVLMPRATASGHVPQAVAIHRDWRYSIGLACSSQSDFVVPPFVCWERGLPVDWQGVKALCDNKGTLCFQGAMNGTVMKDWAEKVLIPTWEAHVTQQAAATGNAREKYRLVLLMDNSPRHTAWRKQGQTFHPGCYVRYFPAYSTKVMQPVDHLFGHAMKEAERALGSFSATCVGSCMTALAVYVTDQMRFNCYELFVKTGHDWKRTAEQPRRDTLHKRYRDWVQEMAEFEDPELQWATADFGPEKGEAKRKKKEVDALLLQLQAEGITLRHIDTAFFDKDAEEWIETPFWAA
eukprot:g17718.t1